MNLFRRLLRGLALMGAGMFFASFFPACSNPPPVELVTPQPTQSEVYNYDAILGPANATQAAAGDYYILQPGDQIEVIRQPVAYGVGEPAVITFTEKLVGPFLSLEAALSARTDQFESASPVVASTTPYQIENWINVTYTSVLRLPVHYEVGYYVFLQKICHQGKDDNHCDEGGGVLSIS